MRKSYLLLALLIPLILGGCFLKSKKDQPLPEEKYATYESVLFNGLSFSARYLKAWNLEEKSSGKFGEYKDGVAFKGDGEEISVTVVKAEDRAAVLSIINVENETQTQVDGTLGNKYAGTLRQAGEPRRLEIVLMESGDYLLKLQTNQPGSGTFVEFLNYFAFTRLEPTKPVLEPNQPVKPRSAKITLSLYFINTKSGVADCQANSVKQVIIDRPENELSLIPDVMKLLIQLSQPEALPDKNISSAIPINTRILSFGYEDNKAIANFSSYLNEGGGSCVMSARRAQIEKTLKALNNVSGLRIKNVEIQVEGDSATALQP